MTQELKVAEKLYPFRELRYLYSRGKPEAVVMKVDDFLGLMETLRITSDKQLMRSLERGLRDIRNGRVHTHKEVFG